MKKNIIIPANLNKRIVKAFFTTKTVGLDIHSVFGPSGMSIDDFYMPLQRHTNRITVLRHDMRRKIADAVITRRKNVLIGVRTADCVPILLYDPVRMVCAAVHAGWKGTAGGILAKTIHGMAGEFYSSPSDIIIAMGPAIRWCCYTVGGDVLRAVISSTGEGDYYERRDGRTCLDLPSANKIQAVQTGVKEENILLSAECTFCRPEKYYSYRYARGPTGRQGGFIGIFP